MKKIRYIICVAMAAIMLLAAAGCQNGSGETAAEPANTEEPSAEAPADQSEYAAKADEAYKAAVEKLVNDKVFPNGEDTGFEADSFFGDMDENKYAIADVDSDGKDELIISFTTAPVAGEVEQVYGYNDADGTLKLKLNEFPLVTYYTNGIAEVAGPTIRAGQAIGCGPIHCSSTMPIRTSTKFATPSTHGIRPLPTRTRMATHTPRTLTRTATAMS